MISFALEFDFDKPLCDWSNLNAVERMLNMEVSPRMPSDDQIPFTSFGRQSKSVRVKVRQQYVALSRQKLEIQDEWLFEYAWL